jgi:autotransporter-associated beta strand protein
MSRTRKTLIGIFLLVLAGIAPWIVLAATQTMNGLASGGCPCGTGWTTVACWNNAAGPVPTTGDDVVIDGGQTPSDTNYNLGGGVQLRSITLNRIGFCTGNVNISGGPIVLQSGGFITDGFCNQGTNGFPGVSLNGPATFTHDACASGSNSSTTSINGALTGTGPLTLVNNLGDDNLRLTVASTYTGSTMVNGTGRVRFDVNGAVATGSALTVNGSALFQASSTIGSLAGGGNVFMNGNNALTAGGDNTSTTFSGVYQNSGGNAALTKTGNGTLTLTGFNTYTGATTVNAGTLAVNNHILSPVTVNNGGTLAGNGTMDNTVTVNSGGTLSPGNSTAIMFTGDLTLNGGGTLTVELNGLSVGSGYDQVLVTGTVTLGGGTLSVLLGFTPTVGNVFTIINNDGTDPVVGTFSGLPEGSTFSAGGRIFQISYLGGDGNDVVLTVVKLNQTITFGPLAPKTFGDSDFSVSASASSGLPVSFSASGQCTVTSPSPGTVHLTGAGSCTITASQGGDVNYNPAPNVPQTFSIAKANQTITFNALADKTFGDADFNVSATASSGLPVSFAASGNCTVNANTVHLTGAGSCTITASQSGNANYNAAADVPQSFTIAKAATTTAVSATPNPSNSGQSVTFTATVTSGAGTPTGIVQFKDGGTNLGSPQTLNGSGVATFATTALTPGMHTITADYSGDVNFLTSSGTLAGGQQVGSIIRFSAPNYNVNENGKFVTITVNRSGDTSPAVDVDFATPDDSAAMAVLPCSTANGVASPRCDFTTALGTLKFASGETSKTFNVLISQDTFVEGNENFALTLSNLTGGAGFAQPSDANATVTIVDDDLSPSTINPIDDAQNFVRQHYHDFLNREPDTAGLDFWTRNITDCGSNQSCIDAMRVNVSAAFFLSIEFQQSGYYVERVWKTSFGDISPPAVPVPVRFTNFLRDTQEVGAGVIVGQGNWQTQLDNNKSAFALSFVQRAGFLSRYPALTSATAFVDSLNANAGGVLSDTERSALISELSPSPSDPVLRADVLRKISENSTLQQREFNRAFVLMQYFGYLRRNPDAAPEPNLNFDGYNFWLNKLNQFNGDFNQAEMVKAFISSTEYRRRFGP